MQPRRRRSPSSLRDSPPAPDYVMARSSYSAYRAGELAELCVHFSLANRGVVGAKKIVGNRIRIWFWVVIYLFTCVDWFVEFRLLRGRGIRKILQIHLAQVRSIRRRRTKSQVLSCRAEYAFWIVRQAIVMILVSAASYAPSTTYYLGDSDEHCSE